MCEREEGCIDDMMDLQHNVYILSMTDLAWPPCMAAVGAPVRPQKALFSFQPTSACASASSAAWSPASLGPSLRRFTHLTCMHACMSTCITQLLTVLYIANADLRNDLSELLKIESCSVLPRPLPASSKLPCCFSCSTCHITISGAAGLTLE